MKASDRQPLLGSQEGSAGHIFPPTTGRASAAAAARCHFAFGTTRPIYSWYGLQALCQILGCQLQHSNSRCKNAGQPCICYELRLGGPERNSACSKCSWKPTAQDSFKLLCRDSLLGRWATSRSAGVVQVSELCPSSLCLRSQPGLAEWSISPSSASHVLATPGPHVSDPWRTTRHYMQTRCSGQCLLLGRTFWKIPLLGLGRPLRLCTWRGFPVLCVHPLSQC